MPSRFFFFNDTATTEIYTLSLHDALPILSGAGRLRQNPELPQPEADPTGAPAGRLWPPRLQEAGGQESVDRGCCAGLGQSGNLCLSAGAPGGEPTSVSAQHQDTKLAAGVAGLCAVRLRVVPQFKR